MNEIITTNIPPETCLTAGYVIFRIIVGYMAGIIMGLFLYKIFKKTKKKKEGGKMLEEIEKNIKVENLIGKSNIEEKEEEETKEEKD